MFRRQLRNDYEGLCNIRGRTRTGTVNELDEHTHTLCILASLHPCILEVFSVGNGRFGHRVVKDAKPGWRDMQHGQSMA